MQAGITSQYPDSTKMSVVPMQATKSDGAANLCFRSLVPERRNADIFQRYDIDKTEVACGGYGKVYLARDRKFVDQQVAIKKVLRTTKQNTIEFYNEMKVMQELDHPNICKLFETFEVGNHTYFVMELCRGGEVFDRIIELGKISEAASADVVRQVGMALAYAHKRGIAHRDLKPENVCFVSDDPEATQVKVIDWGLSFRFGLERMRSKVGSSTYIAPEVLDDSGNDEYSCACDTWSLGVLSYVMLCGRPPFWGSHEQQLKRMKSEKFPLSSDPWDAHSTEAKDFIKSIFKYNPEHRPTMEQLLQHPWLTTTRKPMDTSAAKTILQNMRSFSASSQFLVFCASAVARHLDSRSLEDMHSVFAEMDANGDGVLELREVKTGFEMIFGNDSPEVREVDQMFANLDLDGSGTLDYTEFCAAGISDHLRTQESLLWSAFKDFDIGDDDGKISFDEIKQVLGRADVTKAWSTEVCEAAAKEVMSSFDADGDGTIDFREWVEMTKKLTVQQKQRVSASDVERELVNSLDEMIESDKLHQDPYEKASRKTYDVLQRASSSRKLSRSETRLHPPAFSGSSLPADNRPSSERAIRPTEPSALAKLSKVLMCSSDGSGACASCSVM
eukprot:TRINITY_DN10046_c0_g2_i1.p1 TRINITY_DN10046_c0_g2~~TRINITY_DN10046_c0_g2_i1.p1  ORF type:complete len:625 (-),score=147.64 TRINITY_DN10046_c0_g2_i1:19-1866(-)